MTGPAVQLTPRSWAMVTICETVRAAFDGKYYVRRGDYDLATHNFDQHPFVAYLMCMSNGLETNRESNPFVRAEMQLVLAAARAETGAPSEDPPELSDALIDELSIDAAWLLKEAGRAVHESTEEWKADIHTNTATMQEFHDVGFEVQGIVVTFHMQF